MPCSDDITASVVIEQEAGPDAVDSALAEVCLSPNPKNRTVCRKSSPMRNVRTALAGEAGHSYVLSRLEEISADFSG
jgi:hypothetical protein